MTQPIGTLQAPTAACEDTLSDGGNKFNIHIGCSTQDDHTQYLKTCSVRRLFIETVMLASDNPPEQSVLGDYPTLMFSTAYAGQVRFSLGVPSDMNVEK